MDLSLGICGRCCSKSSREKWMASGSIVSDWAQAWGLRMSMMVKSSPASMRFFSSFAVILGASGMGNLLSSWEWIRSNGEGLAGFCEGRTGEERRQKLEGRMQNAEVNKVRNGRARRVIRSKSKSKVKSQSQSQSQKPHF